MALLGIYREWICSKREKAEALPVTLGDEVGGQVLEIEEEFGWNMIHDKSSYEDIAQTLNDDRLKFFDRKVRRVLQKLETMTFRIKHKLLDVHMFRDYFESITVQAVLKSQSFIAKERDNRSEEEIFCESSN